MIECIKVSGQKKVKNKQNLHLMIHMIDDGTNDTQVMQSGRTSTFTVTVTMKQSREYVSHH